jgi:ABC-2 type transport system permease protein
VTDFDESVRRAGAATRSGGGARILDRGYRPYTGPRTGLRGAVLTVVLNTVQRVLGIRRSVWAKVLPVLMVLVSYIPAIVFIGIVALSPDKGIRQRGFGQLEQLLPTYGSYFGFIVSAIVLFVAFVAPEALCTDRRTGMLGLYLASPLRRDSYLAAKALAVGSVLCMVTIGPPLLLLVAYVLQGTGPDGPVAIAVAALRIAVSGVAIAAFYTALSLAVSSLTDRKAFATAGLILTFLVSAAVSGVLIGALHFRDSVLALNLIVLPLAFVEKVHGESRNFPGVSSGVAIAALFAWTALFAVIVRTRYQRYQITR